jgi:hypothetical protein
MGMETTEGYRRCHLRPYFGRRQLRQITSFKAEPKSLASVRVVPTCDRVAR